MSELQVRVLTYNDMNTVGNMYVSTYADILPFPDTMDKKQKKVYLFNSVKTELPSIINQGISYGAFVDNKLIGFMLTYKPKLVNTVYGVYPFGLDAYEDNCIVIHSAWVEPAYRNHGIMKSMVENLQGTLYGYGLNADSWQALVSLGFVQEAIQDKFVILRRQGTATQNTMGNKPKKKKSKLLIFLIVIIVIVAGLFGAKYAIKKFKPKQVVQTTDYSSLNSALHGYNAKSLDAVIGTKNGDSYLAQEWSWVNANTVREDFLKKIGSTVNVTTNKVTIPDYNALAKQCKSDSKNIKMLYKSAKYAETDYTYKDEVADLMFQWVSDLKEIPTKTVDLDVNLADDSKLDDLLFGSDDFHNFEDAFGQVIVDWTGKKMEDYQTTEMVHNPEYDSWKAKFEERFFADGGYWDAEHNRYAGGHFVKNKSLWEPWYEYDEAGNIQYNEDGSLKVRYYSVKNDDGTDWIQPAEQVEGTVTKQREVDATWEPEQLLLYNLVGTHYISTSYKGNGSKVEQSGNGKKEKPAGVGTSIITKAQDVNGVFHDVRITMKGYWTGKDAITYAEQIDGRNRGFTTDSVVQLITYEIEVENLEANPITLKRTELCLADDNSNISARTGTLYGFSDTVTIDGNKSIIMNDWDASTTLDQKYVCWGRDFAREYPFVYFQILAGTGDIPSYSAFKQFTGNSEMYNSDGSLKEGMTTGEGSQDGTTTTEEGSQDGTATEEGETSKDGATNETSKDNVTTGEDSKDSTTDSNTSQAVEGAK